MLLSHRVTLFRLLGFPIQVDASWLLLAVLVTWSLAAGLFPLLAPGLETATYWWMAVVGLFGLAASIVLHELAHSVVARSYRMPIRSITLFIFGGVAEMEGEPPSAKAEFWVAIAGPVMSLAVAAGFLVLAAAAGGVTGPEIEEPIEIPPLAIVLSYLAFINVILAVFNMVPAFPLDGGRVLRAILWGIRGDILWATRIAAGAGSIFAFMLMGFALINLMGGNPVGGVWYFILGLFLHMAAQGQVYYQITQIELSGIPVERLMRREVVAVAPDLAVERLIADYFYRHFYKSFPVVDGGRLVGVVDADAVKRVEDPAGMRVADIMRPAGAESVVAPDTDTARALVTMQRSGRTRLLVLDHGRVVGVLSLRDLMSYLSLRQQLGRPEPSPVEGRAGG
jgi:Zn-dependent protease/CBS domain-containing protein